VVHVHRWAVGFGTDSKRWPHKVIQKEDILRMNTAQKRRGGGDLKRFAEMNLLSGKSLSRNILGRGVKKIVLRSSEHPHRSLYSDLGAINARAVVSGIFC
jgi:hypothetical protein